MKILFIDIDPQYLLGLPPGFEKQGGQVKILNDIVEEELDRELGTNRPDLVMTAGWTKIHTKGKLAILGRLIEKHRVKHAYWATEDPRWTKEWSMPYIQATHPDFIFTIDRESVPFYRGLGYDAHYLMWACNPDFHRPVTPRAAYQCDIAGDFSQITDYCQQVAGVLKPYGPCNFQSRLLDGKPYIFEINPRFSSSTGMRSLLGVNEAEILLRAEIMGEKVPQPQILKCSIIRQYTDYLVPTEQISQMEKKTPV